MYDDKIKIIFLKQLMEKGIIQEDHFYKVDVLNKEWGFVVQMRKSVDEYYNAIYDKNGNCILPPNCFPNVFVDDQGSIYKTEVELYIDEYGEATILPEYPTVYLKELDENHFIIPTTILGKIGNLLYFIEDNEKVIYKGEIEGFLYGNILNQELELELAENKIVLSKVTIDKDRKEEFFYSWDKNHYMSDRWSSLDSLKRMDFAVITMQRMGLPSVLATEIKNYMKAHNAWLATLCVNSYDQKYHINFFCFINALGVYLTDLMYLAPDNTIKAISLEKKKIGEVDEKRQYIQSFLDEKAEEFKANEEKLTLSFNLITNSQTDAMNSIDLNDTESENQKIKK